MHPSSAVSAAISASLVLPTITGAEATMLILRWFHFIAGITWVGLLYFFNLFNVPFMKQVDASAKPKVLQYMTLPALHWFRWSALVTVFLGFWYWGQFLVGPDAEREGRSGGATIGLFLLIWIVAFWIDYFVIKFMKPNGYVLGVITTIVVYAAGWLFVHYTPVGGDDNHVLCIGIGGGFGIVMMFNVWGIIWPNNKRIIRGTLAGTPPENAAAMARQAYLASRTNFFLSVPLLFYMGAASHFSSTVIFGK
ncbi:MAG TPA: urate hydroxylase PuuD [Candidatus Sulfotelmatobacter sp.]|nr:urate hydroxylase PuuD [Candidatus Sulfotelmatobacter sp.]